MVLPRLFTVQTFNITKQPLLSSFQKIFLNHKRILTLCNPTKIYFDNEFSVNGIENILKHFNLSTAIVHEIKPVLRPDTTVLQTLHRELK